LTAPLLSGRAVQFAAVACVVFLAFTLTEHVWTTSRSEAFGTSTEELETMAASGGWQNQLGFTVLAGLGVLLAVLPGGAPLRPLGLPAILLAANLTWCASSAAWTIDLGLTLRRLGVLAFCTLGALGVTRRLSMRDLCSVAVWCLAAWMLMGILAELSLGTFRPWSGDYRFCGTMHPNAQGGNCAGLCLAAWFLYRDSRSAGRKLAIAGVLVAAFVLLILTKSRTSCLAMFFGIGVIELWHRRASTKLLAGFGVAWGTGVMLLIALFLPAAATGGVTDLVLLGRNEHLGNLNGRTELWSLLMGYIARSPLVGYGYRSFWIPKNITDVSNELYWGISSAHSVYLETLLSAGLIGLALVLAWTICVALRSLKLWNRSGDIGLAFFLSLLVYASIDGILESSFVAPSFLTWLAGCGLIRLSLFSEPFELRGAVVRSPRSSTESSPRTPFNGLPVTLAADPR